MWAANVPINLKWPESRIVALLEVHGLDARVTDVNGARLLTPEVLSAAPATVVVPDALPEIVGRNDQNIICVRDIADAKLAAPVPVAADDLPYIIFTSGTTGMPRAS